MSKFWAGIYISTSKEEEKELMELDLYVFRKVLFPAFLGLTKL